MDTSRHGSKIWEWIGRIAVLVAILGGVIFLVQWFNPDAPRLEVKGEYYEWPKIGTSITAELFWRFNIENTGGEIAKNIRIEFPFDGKFALDDTPELKEFNKRSIQIDNLQPSDKKTLRVWSLGGNFFKDEIYKDKIKVVHDSGTAYVDYPTLYNGPTNSDRYMR